MSDEIESVTLSKADLDKLLNERITAALAARGGPAPTEAPYISKLAPGDLVRTPEGGYGYVLENNEGLLLVGRLDLSRGQEHGAFYQVEPVGSVPPSTDTPDEAPTDAIGSPDKSDS
jgi:hypothetical protein